MRKTVETLQYKKASVENHPGREPEKAARPGGVLKYYKK